MTCLKHVTLKQGSIILPVGFPVRVCDLKLSFVNTYHDVVVRIESRCVNRTKSNELTDQQYMFYYIKRVHSFPAKSILYLEIRTLAIAFSP